MRFGVLGPLQVTGHDDVEITIGAPKVRSLLVALVLDAGRVVPADRLVDAIWEDRAPARAMVSLRSYVSNLRRLLCGPDGQPLIVTRGRGYVLDVDPVQVDVSRFERCCVDARTALGGGDPQAAIRLLDEGLALWRGPALVDVDELAFAQPEIARLEELRLTAVEDRIDALLAAGRHDEAVPFAEAQAAAHPLRERPHLQLMLGLHRAGRTPDALAVHRRYRDLLTDELGLDPSPRLDRLATQVLRQDPELAFDAAAAPTSAAGPSVGQPVGSHHQTVGSTGATQPTVRVDHTAPVRVGRTDPVRVGRTDQVLVGRTDERARLAAALDDVAAGRGGVVVLGGEPGIGKSALLSHLAERANAAGVPTAWGRCAEADGAPAFWPWIQVVRTIVEGLDDDALAATVAGHAAAIGQLVPEAAARTGRPDDRTGAAPPSARFAMHDAVTSFLARHARPSGLVVLIEDLHWGDLASCELTAFLGSRAAAGRVLLAVSHRDSPADVTPELGRALGDLVRDPGVEPLHLEGLDVAEVGSLLEHLGSDLAPDRVQARAGGNPFYVRQLTRLLAEADGQDRVPAGVRQVVVQRLVRVPSEVRATLDVAALLGEDIDASLLARCLQRDLVDVLDDLDVAVAHGLVDAGAGRATGYRFTHALVRETLAGELPTGRAVRWHARIADVLEALPRPPAEALSEHLWQAAELVGAERPVRWLRAAAEEAAAVFAHEQAEQALRRALHLLAHDPAQLPEVELAVRLRLIQILNSLHGWTSGAIEEVAGRVFELADEGGIGPEVTAMWWALWAMYMTRGELQVARQAADRLLDGVRDDGQPDEVLSGHVAVAYTGMFVGTDLATVHDHLDAALAAEAETDPVRLDATPEHLAVALRISRAMAHGLAGEREQAIAAAADAVAVGDALGDPFRRSYARLFGAWTGALLDDPDLAHEHSSAGLELCERAGLPGIAALILPNHVWAAARLGGDAATLARQGVEVDAALVGAGQRHAVPHGRLLLAEVHLLAGDLDGYRRWLHLADAMADEIGEHVYDRTRSRVIALADER